MGSPLEYAKSNYEGHLRKALVGLAAGHSSPVHYFMAGFSYRVLGICALLLEADRDTFAAMLCKSGRARLAFLERVATGLDAPPKYRCASKDIAFSAALAAGDIDTAARIASLSPMSHFDGVEYEDDFSFVHFLHRIVCAPADRTELDRTLNRWQEVREGQPSGYLDVCKALFTADPDEFGDAFASLIMTRQDQLTLYREAVTCDDELYATEGKVFVEGLAVLRIAEMNSLPTLPEYNLIPSIARIPPRHPLPPVDSWKHA